MWIVADAATYYTSQELMDFGRSGIGLTLVPAEAHWLMGSEEQAIGEKDFPEKKQRIGRQPPCRHFLGIKPRIWHQYHPEISKSPRFFSPNNFLFYTNEQ